MIFISDLREGDYVDGIYLCKTKMEGKTKSGRTYYGLTLQDRTGTVDAKVWDLSSGIDHFEALNYIHVTGEATLYQNAVQLNIRRIYKAREGEYDPADYMPSSPYNEEEMFKKITAYAMSIKNQYLGQLVRGFFVDDSAFIKAFRKHSAAKSVHHSFMNGLLQHTLRVTELCDFYCLHYPVLQRDLLISGALLHDIGKIREIGAMPENEYTDAGQLLGHIAMGYEMVAARVRQIPGFPEKLEHEIEHLILSHHGELEYGSPKKPSLIEAVALHFADNTDARLETITEIFENAQPGTGWLGYQKFVEANVRRSTDLSKE